LVTADSLASTREARPEVRGKGFWKKFLAHRCIYTYAQT
jgi:hypothetical protein